MDVIVKGQPAIEVKIEAKVVDTYKTPDSALSETSTNPVQNKVITTELNKKALQTEVSALETKVNENKTATDTALSGLSAKVDEEVEALQTELDSNGVLIEDLQESKADVSGYYPQLSVGQADNLPDRGDVVEGLLGFRESAGAGNSIEDGTANVQELLGESLVWNQRIDTKNWRNNSVTEASLVINGGFVEYVAPIGASGAGIYVTTASMGVITGHKYIVSLNLQTNQPLTLYALGKANSGVNTDMAFITDATDTRIYLARPAALTEELTIKARLLLTDLTQMFGAGNEPTTVEEFEAIKNQLVGVDFTAYNAGEVLGVNIKGIKSVNDNAWDEEWEVGGLDTTTGENIDYNGRIRSKNFIKVLGGQEYYFSSPSQLAVRCYDINKNFLGQSLFPFNGTAVIPSNCAYIRFNVDYTTSYNHDICIRLAHSGYKTDYVAHEESKSSFDLTPYFPDGMHGINGVRDSVTKSKAVRRFGVVDLGSLSYAVVSTANGGNRFVASNEGWKVPTTSSTKGNLLCKKYLTITADDVYLENVGIGISSNTGQISIYDPSYTDAATFKAAMQGVMLYYELATPIETEIDPQLNMNYKVWDFGTEELLTDSKSAPVLARTIYGFNATDTIRGNKAKNEEQDARITDLENEVVRVGDYQPDLSVGVADNLAGTEYTESEIGFRRSGGGAILDGNARVSSVKGNSVVWNQQLDKSSRTITHNGVTFTVKDDGSIVANGTATAFSYIGLRLSFKTLSSHKYLVAGTPTGGSRNTYFFGNGVKLNDETGKGIIASGEDNTNTYACRVLEGVTVENVVFRPQFHDLTLMFGAGNEPTTIEEFYARKPKVADENAFNEGEVIHMEADAIKSVGVNQWDEEWEVGTLSSTEGLPITSASAIRVKDFIKVLPSSDYYVTAPTEIQGNIRLYFYDATKNFINRGFDINDVFTTPANAHYMKLIVNGTTTYKNDICINLSDTEVNGKYFPYVKREQTLEMLKKYFPQGMKSAGTAHDEIRWNAQKQKWEAIKRIGEVKMKDLSWGQGSNARVYSQSLRGLTIAGSDSTKANVLVAKYTTATSGEVYLHTYDKIIAINAEKDVYIYDSQYTADVDSFRASLTDNDILYYELAEPVVTEIDENFNLDYEVWNAGTEQMIADTPSTPVKASIAYGFNAVGKIKQLEEIIAQLQTAIANLSNS